MKMNLGVEAESSWEGPGQDRGLVVRVYLVLENSFQVQIARYEYGRYGLSAEEAERYAIKAALEAFAEIIKEHKPA